MELDDGLRERVTRGIEAPAEYQGVYEGWRYNARVKRVRAF